jgi:hypothetical protein
MLEYQTDPGAPKFRFDQMRQSCRFVAGAKANAEFALIEAKLTQAELAEKVTPGGGFRRKQPQKDAYHLSIISFSCLVTVRNLINCIELNDNVPVAWFMSADPRKGQGLIRSPRRAA